ncbi:MAG: DUF4166 domain-containing protein [Devosia sp.]
MTRPHVLIVGAGGTFGSRLARLLAQAGRFQLSLGGRSPGKLAALTQELSGLDPDGSHTTVEIDRDKVTPEDLRALGCQIVVDCAGPFQLSGPNLITAAIAAPCRYVDLADSRQFIAGIAQFDAAARAGGICVITGASSTPALSNAALDSLAAGWRSLDTIDCAIVPGNQTPKGRSVIEGILSWVGQPVRVFREGEWQTGHGWSHPRWVTISGLKRRRAMLADVPDLDTLSTRWSPRVRAGFDAGMELPVLNWLIALSGLAVRWRLVPSARVFTGLGTFIANALDRFGSQDGGMLIEISGEDADGQNTSARWQLKATSGHGPYVPIGPAAAMVQRLAFGTPVEPGARSAVGLLSIDEISTWYTGLSIDILSETSITEPPLYQRVLGAAFSALPETTRRLHRGTPAIVVEGEALVRPARSPLNRVIARLLGMPTRPGTVPVHVIIEQRNGREYWSRNFAGKIMRSEMREAGGLIAETFGPFSIRMKLVADASGLDMQRVDGSFLGLPIPTFLLPQIKAEERVDEQGRHLFDVEIDLPLFGRLVAYRGHLSI